MSNRLCDKCKIAQGYKRADDGFHTAQMIPCELCGKVSPVLPDRHWRRVDLPLPEVVEIKPVNQFADKLYGMITAPSKDKLWNEPVKKANWAIEYER